MYSYVRVDVWLIQTSLPVRGPCYSDVRDAATRKVEELLFVFPQVRSCHSVVQRSCRQSELEGWSHGRVPLWPPQVPSSFPLWQPEVPGLQRWHTSCRRRGCTLEEFGKVWLQGCYLPLSPLTSFVCQFASDREQTKNWGSKEGMNARWTKVIPLGKSTTICWEGARSNCIRECTEMVVLFFVKNPQWTNKSRDCTLMMDLP